MVRIICGSDESTPSEDERRAAFTIKMIENKTIEQESESDTIYDLSEDESPCCSKAALSFVSSTIAGQFLKKSQHICFNSCTRCLNAKKKAAPFNAAKALKNQRKKYFNKRSAIRDFSDDDDDDDEFVFQSCKRQKISTDDEVEGNKNVVVDIKNEFKILQNYDGTMLSNAPGDIKFLSMKWSNIKELQKALESDNFDSNNSDSNNSDSNNSDSDSSDSDSSNNDSSNNEYGTNQYIEQFIDEMQEAYEEDRKMNLKGREGLKKSLMADAVVHMMNRHDIQKNLLEKNLLGVLSNWLSPLPGGFLFSADLRTRILCELVKNFLDIDRSYITKSGMRQILPFLEVHGDETPENRRLAEIICNEWGSEALM